jgi:pyridine nucleotide-disulfide oxidoreductase family protein
MVRRIILGGGGHSHLAVLADWAKQPLAGTERRLVTRARHTAYSGMVPGWMAGHYARSDLFIDLAPLAERAGAELVLDEITALDAGAGTVTTATGSRFAFDVASIATGGIIDCADLAALGERLIPVRPIERFVERWSDFIERARHRGSANLAVIGGGAAGVELAFAARAGLDRAGVSARIMLVAEAGRFLAGHAAAVRRRARAELGRRAIGIVDGRAHAGSDCIILDDGHEWPVDGVIAATGSRAPAWLAASGLAVDTRGFVAVGSDLRSVSHDRILAAGDIINRIDRPVERSGVHAVKAGPVIAANLRAAVTGSPVRSYRARHRSLYLFLCARHRAILSWGPLCVAGRWPWLLKDRIDRGFVMRNNRMRDGTAGTEPVCDGGKA